ncbi:MAG: bifunctional riboflavin kinase/FAD synthetase [Gammaproteobacteria bacterium]|nr:bifunctional riboflavin kinase/FAD synthetase [Gammaproteobacteria bacterium]
MEIIRGVGDLTDAHRGCALSIGNFDGVHRGHRAVLAQLAGTAAGLNVPATVMTFEPTPKEFFVPDQAPARLTTLREKLGALQATACIDKVVVTRFDEQMASLPPEEFIERLLVQRLSVRYVIVGDDFRFGHRRKGDFDMLSRAGLEHGFDVATTESFELDGVRVSSTAIRAALAAGDLAYAARMLGRPYSMIGRVRRGEQLGRKLGYPTANISPGRLALPLHGIFAVLVRRSRASKLPGVASLGTRPTVDGQEPMLEVHLFDFDDNLYGERLEVQFIARLRDEEHFPDLASMVEQMHRDAALARELLEQYAEGEP